MLLNNDNNFMEQLKKKQNGRGLSDEEKQKIVNEFIKRKERLAIKLGIVPSWQKTEEIADELGVSIRSIFTWKKEFGLIESKEYFTKKKLNVAKQFEKLKKQNSRMTNLEIAAKLNVTGSQLAQCRKVSHSKKFHTDAEKRELLNQFDEIKRKNPKLSAKNIHKMLSISRETLRRWRKLLDERDKLDAHSSNDDVMLSGDEASKLSENKGRKRIIGDDEKQRIVKKFLEKKAQLTNELGIALSWQKTEEIADELGVSIRSITNWKKEFVIIPEKSDGEKGKIEVVKHYKKMKRQNPKMPNKEIATKLGIIRNRLDIYRKQFDPDYQKAKFYNNETKIELVKQYHQIKRNDPQLPDEEIAKLFDICTTSLCLWKKQFAEHVLSDEASER
uniref:Transposase n=1 Tax=Globodera rostochiensis TaxID=31243 RepID=A0A914HXX8_GLORO